MRGVAVGRLPGRGSGGARVKIKQLQTPSPAAAKADGQYINVLAKVESLQPGVRQRPSCSTRRRVESPTDHQAENLFIVHDGVLFTPPAPQGPGATRHQRANSSDAVAGEREYVPVREEKPRSHGAYNADECFFTGTAAESSPNSAEVDDQQVGAGHRGAVTKDAGAPSSTTKDLHGTPTGSWTLRES